MEIAVCVKQVLDTEEVCFDQCNNLVRREGIPMILNPADRTALLAAAVLKRRYGGRITALTMGTPQSVNVLHEAAIIGADALVLVTDPAFASADTYATAHVLSEALKKCARFDLVLCGRRAIDGETGQVGPELSVKMNMFCLTNVTRVTEYDDQNRIVCTRLTETDQESYRVDLPVLLTMCEGFLPESLPSIADLRRANAIPVLKLTNRELRLPPQSIGLQGSFTRVRKIRNSSSALRECAMFDASEGARIAARLMAAAGSGNVQEKRNLGAL